MRRPTIFVVLAGLAAMLAAVVVYRALKSREAAVRQAMAQSVEIVVAAYDLPLGTKVEAGELKMARWSADSLPKGAYRSFKPVVGKYVKSSFVANEPMVMSKLFTGQKTAGVMPLLIPAGMRAMSVPVDEVSDIAGFVQPRSRVDVLVAVSSSSDNGKAFSKVVLQNVEVLAVAQEVEKKKDEPQVVKVVTLLVTPQEAERLALASREGTLRLAMRSYNDNKIVLTRGADLKRMFRAYSAVREEPLIRHQVRRRSSASRRRQKPFKVEILRNGKSSESVSFVNEAVLSRAEKPAGAGGRTALAAAKTTTTTTSRGTAVAASVSKPRALVGPRAKTIELP